MDAHQQNPRRDPVEEDRRLQADPELVEGRARPSQILWVAAAGLAIIVLLFYGINSSGTGNNVSTTPQANAPAQQNSPPASAGADQSNANTQAGATQGGNDQNAGVRSGTTQRSSEVDDVGGGSVRNPGSGKIAAPPEQR